MKLTCQWLLMLSHWMMTCWLLTSVSTMASVLLSSRPMLTCTQHATCCQAVQRRHRHMPSRGMHLEPQAHAALGMTERHAHPSTKLHPYTARRVCNLPQIFAHSIRLTAS